MMFRKILWLLLFCPDDTFGILQNADIIFLWDVNVNEDIYSKTVKFSSEFLNEFKNPLNDFTNRIGVVEYGDNAKTIASLNQFNTIEEVRQAMKNNEPAKGGDEVGNLYEGIIHTSTLEGMRSDKGTVLFVMTNGYTSAEVNAVAQKFKELKSNGWIVFVITSSFATDESFLKKIASEDDYVLGIDEYYKLQTAISRIDAPEPVSDIEVYDCWTKEDNLVMCVLEYKNMKYISDANTRRKELKWKFLVTNLNTAEEKEWIMMDKQISFLEEKVYFIENLQPLTDYLFEMFPIGKFEGTELEHFDSFKTPYEFDADLIPEMNPYSEKLDLCHPKERINIIIIGPCGAGKSALGNTALSICLPWTFSPANKFLQAERDNAVTLTVEGKPMEGGETKNEQEYFTYIYDTPGIEVETEGRGGCWNTEVLEEIIEGSYILPFSTSNINCKDLRKNHYKTHGRHIDDEMHAVLFVIDAYKFNSNYDMYEEKYGNLLIHLERTQNVPVVIVGSFLHTLLNNYERYYNLDIYTHPEVIKFRTLAEQVFGLQKTRIYVLQQYTEEQKRNEQQENLVIHPLHVAYSLGLERKRLKDEL